MSFAPKQFIRSVDFLSTENAINTSTGCVNIFGGMSVSRDSYLTNMIVVGNSTVNNLNITGALITSTGNTLISSQWNNVGANGVYFGTSANAFVGIGTTTPTFNLDISGGSRITGGLTVGNLNVNTGASITNLLNTTICTGTVIITGGALRATFNSNTVGNIFTTGGNVGIGTTAPGSRLEVNGTIKANDITVGNINFTGNLFQNGSAYLGSQWTTTAGNTLTYTSGNVRVSNGFTSSFNSNTLGNIFTTGGNIGVGTTSPAYNLDVTGSGDFSTFVTSGALYSTNQTTTNIVATNISTSTLLSSNMTSYNSTIYLRGDTNHGLRWAGSGNSWGNYTPDGPVLFGYAAGALGTTFTNGLGKIILTWFDNGNVGIGTTSPGSTLDVSGTARFTTSVTTGALYSTNQTTTNIVGTNLSSNNLVSTTSTFGSNTATGVQYLLNATTIQATTNNYSLTSGALNVTGDIVLSGSELMFTTTNVGAPTLNGRGWGSKIVLYPETGTTRGDYSIGVESAYTWFQAPSLSAHGFKFYQGTTASVIINPGGHVSILNTANISTISSGSLFLSGNLSVAGTLTTVNITSTNLVNTNVSAGVVVASTLLSATGNSNTIGNIFTTGGNVGIGLLPTSPHKLEVNGVLGLSSLGHATGSNNYSIQLLAPAGSALETSIRFHQTSTYWHQIRANASGFRLTSGDSNTLTTLDTILATTNNSNTIGNIIYTTGGNVGIGTASPAYKLDVTGSGDFSTFVTSGALYSTNQTTTNIVSTNISTGVVIASTLLSATGNSNTVGSLFTTSGNVGIGTVSPRASLELSSTAQTQPRLILSGQEFYAAGNTSTSGIALLAGINRSTNRQLWFADSSLLTQNTSNPVIRIIPNGPSINAIATDGMTPLPLSLGSGAGYNLSISTNGNIGIGTTTPRSNLEMTGTTTTVGLMLFSGNDTGINSIFFNHSNTTSQYIKTAIQTQALGTNQFARSHFGILVNTTGDTSNVSWSDSRFFIHGSSGNIGIGTTSPSRRLHISGDQEILRVNSNASNEASIGFYPNTAGSTYFKIGNGISNFISQENLIVFNSNINNPHVYFTNTGNTIFTSSGNVGIGSASPQTKLHIEDGSVFIGDISAGFSTTVPAAPGSTTPANSYRLFFDNSYNGTAGTGVPANKIVLHNNSFTAGFGLEIGAVTYHSGDLHRFYCGSNGTSTYGGVALSVGATQTIVSTNTNGEGLLKIGNINNGSGAFGMLRIGNNSGDAVMFINSSNRSADGGTGTFTIRNDAGALRLQGAGANNTIFLPGNSSNIGIGTTSPSYALHVSGDIYSTGDMISFSDVRLKTDVVTIDNALDKVSNMRGVYYTNLNTQTRETGVIAQEIKEILPEVVGDKGDYLGVAYGNIVGVLIEAIKELKARIVELESKN